MLTLPELLEQAKAHSLYAHWPLETVRAFGDSAWRRLPTLRADALRAHRPQPDQGKILYLSSGTTGNPKLVSYGKEDLQRVIDLCARFSELEGISRKSRVMVLLPMALWPVGRITVGAHRQIGARVFPVDLHGGIPAWQKMAETIRPTVISSTPSVLAHWAPHYDGPPLELVETTGEPLLHHERHLIEGCFGGRVHDAYGLSECVVGVECAIRHGFHYWPDATGVEVLEPGSDRPVPPGEPGELVLTSFQQASRPILRYRSGDLGWIDPTPCPCGRREPRVHLAGRINPTLQLPRGITLEEASLHEALAELGIKTRLRYKTAPESPAARFLASAFQPTLEVSCQTSCPADQVREHLLASLPELGELIHEKELRLVVGFADNLDGEMGSGDGTRQKYI